MFSSLYYNPVAKWVYKKYSTTVKLFAVKVFLFIHTTVFFHFRLPKILEVIAPP